MPRPKRNLPEFVILRDAFLEEADPMADAALPLNPPVDLYETQDGYVLNVELPGVQREDIHVEVRGTELSIQGERRGDSYCCEENYHRMEGIRGRFHRTFRLPETFGDDARIQASLKDGVLHLELGKSTKSRNISIKSAGESR
jgi:HSP20 family protein